MLWLILLTTLSLIDLSLEKEKTKLLLVQTLSRHGDRAPFRLYPGDPNTGSCFPEGLGSLTLLGKKQLYAVGKYLRSIYKDFITSNPNEIYVNSSADDRCLSSAEANIASLYAPEGIWKFEKDLNWQPIPVHYIPSDKDKYLSFPECPKSTQITLDLYGSDKVKSFFQDNKKTLDKISKHVGFNVSGIATLSRFADTLKAEKIHNLTIPKWVEPHLDLLERGAGIIKSCSYADPELLRLRSGPLLELIMDNMKGKINGSIPDMKVQVFSSHDENLGAMLLALTSIDFPRPPYAATIVFELHQMQNKKEAVRIFYLNSTRPEIDVGEPHILTVKGCSELCPLDKFYEIIRPLIPDDWNAECQDTRMLTSSEQELKAMLESQLSNY